MSAATPGSSVGCRHGQLRSCYRQSQLQGLLHAHLGAPSWGSGPSTSPLLEAPSHRGSVIAHARRKWYAIFEPASARGVYRYWEQVKREVIGYSGAVHKGFTSEAAALRWILDLGNRAREEEDQVLPLREQVARLASAAAEASALGQRALAGRCARQSAAIERVARSGAASPDLLDLTTTAPTQPQQQQQQGLEASGPRPWETSPIVLDVDAVPTREYYRKWYAVRFVDGGRPGVYNTWQEAEAAINGRYSEHRSFDSYPQALTFAFGPSYAQQQLPSPPSSSPPPLSEQASQQQIPHHHHHQHHQHADWQQQWQATELTEAVSEMVEVEEQQQHQHQQPYDDSGILASVVRQWQQHEQDRLQQHQLFPQDQEQDQAAFLHGGGWDGWDGDLATASTAAAAAEGDGAVLFPLSTAPTPQTAPTRAMALAAADGAVVQRSPVNPDSDLWSPLGTTRALPGPLGWSGGASGGGGGRPLPAPPLLSMAPLPYGVPYGGRVLPPVAAVPTSGLGEAPGVGDGEGGERLERQQVWVHDDMPPSTPSPSEQQPATTSAQPLSASDHVHREHPFLRGTTATEAPGRRGRGRPPLRRPAHSPGSAAFREEGDRGVTAHPPSTSGRWPLAVDAAAAAEPARRGRGRPRKMTEAEAQGLGTAGTAAAAAAKRPRGRPRRVVGDNPKPAGVAVAAGQQGALGGAAPAEAQGLGTAVTAGPPAAAALGAAATAAAAAAPKAGRGPGRPRKDAVGSADVTASTPPTALPGAKRPRGRPPKPRVTVAAVPTAREQTEPASAAASVAAAAAAGGAVGVKRRGRPRKQNGGGGAAAQATAAAEGAAAVRGQQWGGGRATRGWGWMMTPLH